MAQQECADRSNEARGDARELPWIY